MTARTSRMLSLAAAFAVGGFVLTSAVALADPPNDKPAEGVVVQAAADGVEATGGAEDGQEKDKVKPDKPDKPDKDVPPGHARSKMKKPKKPHPDVPPGPPSNRPPHGAGDDQED